MFADCSFSVFRRYFCVIVRNILIRTSCLNAWNTEVKVREQKNYFIVYFHVYPWFLCYKRKFLLRTN